MNMLHNQKWITTHSWLLLVVLVDCARLLASEPTAAAADPGTRLTKRESPARAEKRVAEKKFETDCLRAHNKWRRSHQAPALVFDRKIAAFAQKRANFIAKSDGDEFKHPPDLPYGENLAWHSRSNKSCADLVKMWYDEVELYDYANPKFSHEAGHFTQLVWRSTRRVGCARAFSSGPNGGVYLVCNYDPPGNFLGEFVDNVLECASPARSTTAMIATTTTTSAPPATSTTTTTTTTTPPTTTTSEAPPVAPTKSPVEEPTSGGSSKKPNGKRKNKNKGNKKRNKKNKNKRRNNNNSNNKKQKLESNSTTTTTTATPADSLRPSQ